jgi:hypothetical protein
VPLFELVLQPRGAKTAVPVLAIVSVSASSPTPGISTVSVGHTMATSCRAICAPRLRWFLVELGITEPEPDKSNPVAADARQDIHESGQLDTLGDTSVTRSSREHRPCAA